MRPREKHAASALSPEGEPNASSGSACRMCRVARNNRFVCRLRPSPPLVAAAAGLAGALAFLKDRGELDAPVEWAGRTNEQKKVNIQASISPSASSRAGRRALTAPAPPCFRALPRGSSPRDWRLPAVAWRSKGARRGAVLAHGACTGARRPAVAHLAQVVLQCIVLGLTRFPSPPPAFLCRRAWTRCTRAGGRRTSWRWMWRWR